MLGGCAPGRARRSESCERLCGSSCVVYVRGSSHDGAGRKLPPVAALRPFNNSQAASTKRCPLQRGHSHDHVPANNWQPDQHLEVDMEGWSIIGSVMAVAVTVGAIYDRLTRRRGGYVNSEPDRSPYGVGADRNWPL